MQIVCPNCSTAYEIPDAVFGGRARKLRCENCGTQWRAGPPGAGDPAQSAVPGLPGAEAGRVFGKPADAKEQAELREAMERETGERETGERAAQGHIQNAHHDSGESQDPFINLVQAARSRAIEFEPDPPAEPRLRISSPALVGSLLTLFVLSVGFLLLHAR